MDPERRKKLLIVAVIEGSAVEGKAFLTLEELKSMEEGLVETDYFSLNLRHEGILSFQRYLDMAYLQESEFEG